MVKNAILFAAIIVAVGWNAFAFDASRWLEKREAVIDEALRLKTAYTNCLANLDQPATEVTVPIETHDDGSIKSIVYAKKAQYFLKAGLVWAEDVVAKKFDKDGTINTTIEAKNCVIDRIAKAGWAEGPAKVVHRDTVFTGEGVYFSSPEGYIRVFDQSEIVSKDLKFGGLRP